MKKSQLEPTRLQEFPGFQFNTKELEITVPKTKLSKLITRNQTSKTTDDEADLLVDCEYIGENDFDDTSDRGSSVAYKTHSKGLSVISKSKSQEMGSQMSPLNEESRGTGMVARMGSLQEWITNPSHTVDQYDTEGDYPCRCVGLRLGSSLGIGPNMRILGPTPKRRIDQGTGIEHGIVRLTDSHKRYKKLDDSNIFRQHNGSEICKETGRNIASVAAKSCHPDPRYNQREQHVDRLPTCARNRQYSSKQAEQEEGTTPNGNYPENGST